MYSKIYDYVDEEIVLNRIINNATRYFINNTEVDKQKYNKVYQKFLTK
jgi:DNA repair ATPase RecN